MRQLLWLIPVLLAAPAFAAGEYDGVYSGVIQPTPGMSNPACTLFPIASVMVKDGNFHNDAPSLNGNVNVKGFVTGKMGNAGQSDVGVPGPRQRDRGRQHAHHRRADRQPVELRVDDGLEAAVSRFDQCSENSGPNPSARSLMPMSRSAFQ